MAHALLYGSCYGHMIAKLILFVDVIIFYLFDNKQLRKTKKTLRHRKAVTTIRVLLWWIKAFKHDEFLLKMLMSAKLSAGCVNTSKHLKVRYLWLCKVPVLVWFEPIVSFHPSVSSLEKVHPELSLILFLWRNSITARFLKFARPFFHIMYGRVSVSNYRSFS